MDQQCYHSPLPVPLLNLGSRLSWGKEYNIELGGGGGEWGGGLLSRLLLFSHKVALTLNFLYSFVHDSGSPLLITHSDMHDIASTSLALELISVQEKNIRVKNTRMRQFSYVADTKFRTKYCKSNVTNENKTKCSSKKRQQFRVFKA